MKRILSLTALLFSFMLLLAQEDKYIWLEEIDGEKQLKWVEEWNKKSEEVLTKHEKYDEVFKKSLEIYNSSERIARPTLLGDYIYNFWQDAEHVRGIWRRSPKRVYLDGNPQWETLIDIDEMYAMDSIKWVYKGASGLSPDYKRFMVYLSKGGGDATVIREYDVDTKTFVENGFSLEESKGGVSWLDENTLMVSRDFGEGTMTTSGYPRQVKIWKRGTGIDEAELVYEGEETDVGTWGFAFKKGEKTYAGVAQAITFYTSNLFMFDNEELVKIDIPQDADFSDILGDQAIISLKSDWTIGEKTFKQGSVISAHYPSLLEGKHDLTLIVEPDERSSVTSSIATKNRLVFNMLNNVKSELYSYRFENGRWEREKIEAPALGAIRLGSNDDVSDEFFFYYENFLTPSSLHFANASDNSFKIIKSLPSFFDSEKYKVLQYEAESKDGTMIPYFVIGAKELESTPQNPTLLYAYGGFEVSRLPFYSATWGSTWLDNGGVFVMANIRGGGEFGPRWHQAGLKENRQRVYDDFHAVAEDLIERKITASRNLGIYGGSNGGLLVGAAFTQRPDLYEAVVCAVPLLDMKRYNKLLAGASWMGEYGNPDIPEEWEYIKKYSPYHNLKEDMKYPEVLFMTSTRDDRVHPGHARKMVAKMADMGHKIYYYENTEGGHAGSSTNEQRAKAQALRISYLLMKLSDSMQPPKIEMR